MTVQERRTIKTQFFKELGYVFANLGVFKNAFMRNRLIAIK